MFGWEGIKRVLEHKFTTANQPAINSVDLALVPCPLNPAVGNLVPAAFYLFIHERPRKFTPQTVFRIKSRIYGLKNSTFTVCWMHIISYRQTGRDGEAVHPPLKYSSSRSGGLLVHFIVQFSSVQVCRVCGLRKISCTALSRGGGGDVPTLAPRDTPAPPLC